MNFHRLFLLLVVAIFLVLGGHSGVEAAPRWKLGKKLEKVGKNVFKAAQKALPVVAGFKALG
ncbi:cecropin-B-like [Culex pipiens pallens]|uniref:Cecropin B n=1 Tax=Culex quinquefasciatus TaxID=7176 RepID=A0A192Y4Q7_CULQU|nr:cecropin-B-like [Culex pipiens pallens]ANM44743.1 cecropin B [Culex quinquefasciatus]